MRRWIIVAACVFFAVSASARETLVGEGFHSGGYGGPVWKVGLMNGKAGLISGGRGGWIINHKFAIGGGGYGMVTDIETDGTSADGKPLFMTIEYGGFEMEYIHNSDKLFHWTFHTLLGSGRVKLKEHDPKDEIASDSFYIVEPSLNIDFNIATWFRIGVGASYRVVFGVDLEDVSPSEVGGPSGLIIFKFGSF